MYRLIIYIQKMVYYETGQGKGKKKYGLTLGVGPVKITSKHPTLQNQVKNVKKAVHEMQSKEELKYVDTLINGTFSNTATGTLLNGMIQANGSGGNDQSERVGNQISPTSIQFRLIWTPNSNDVAQGNIFRHIIVWDQQANGTGCSYGDIVDQSVITNPTLAPYKREYQKRFKIVYDKVKVFNSSFGTVINSSATPAAPTSVYADLCYAKAKKALSRVVKYRNAQNTGTITDIASNALWSFIVSSTGSGGTITCGYRMYFKDD